jgi:hypothetical protein
MCLSKLFKKKSNDVTVTSTSADLPLTLPHPEEPINPNATMDNVSIGKALTDWCDQYNVPLEYHPFWFDAIVITLSITISYPAGTWEQDGKRHMIVRPEWLNPGVIAHEQAHNSYALLTDSQKTEFSAKYNPLKDTDPLIKLLYSQNTYGLTNDIEGHAEIYRYLGDKMPLPLKPFYPKLF